MNLFIYVEGQEEELFVNRVLRNHLWPFGVLVKKPILAATSFRIGDDEVSEITVGGVTNYGSIRQDILDQYQTGEIQDSDVLTTFIDLYALPKDFPGHAASIAQDLAGGQKAGRIEQAWKEDIGRPNFFPYIQVHEFETLVLTRPSELANLYAEHAASIEELRIECAGFLTPEDINETREGAPSHRIKARVPNYVKVEGFRFLQSIGIPELKARCPRFCAWIERCERFFG
jgi:Domain of unknown function (DUF4276)